MISYCIITKDEADNLKKCIEAIKAHSPELEINVADTGSSDESVNVARSMGARVFDFPWVDDFIVSQVHTYMLSHFSHV